VTADDHIAGGQLAGGIDGRGDALISSQALAQ
jgi:hypothetical protein